jgi:hypothetical protein
MLVAHIEHKNQAQFSCTNSDDLDSFFEYIDEVVLNNVDQTADNEENDGQLIDEVAKEDLTEQDQFCLQPHTYVSFRPNNLKIYLTSRYIQRVNSEVIAPPPDCI